MPPGIDAGGARDAGDTRDAGPSPQANANDVVVYLGQVVQVDGSGSGPSDATFAWTIASAPAGSTITTAALQTASGSQATFKPDKAGTYALTLVVTSHGASSARNVTVRAVEAPVFYNDLSFAPDGGALLGIHAVSTSGTNARSILCAGQSTSNGELLEIAFIRSIYASDWWEAPAGQDSRLAYTALAATDAGFVSQLWAATSATTCGSPPTKLEEHSSASAGAGQYGLKLSPDGSRVAYVTIDEGMAVVRTVGFDGSTPHQLAPFHAGPDGTPLAESGIDGPDQSPLRWRGTQLAWANLALGDGTRFQIVSATDQNDATPSVLMRCSGILRTFDFLPSGDVIASLQSPGDGGTTSAFDLVVLRPNAVSKECEVVRNLTNLAAGSLVQAAALSPDGTRVAYLVNDSAVDAGAAHDSTRLAVATVDGSSAPRLVEGVPFSAGAEPLIGFRPVAPRWVAGGTALTFQILQSAIDAGDGGGQDYPAVAVVSASGGDVRAVAVSDAEASHIVTAMGGCSVARGAGSGMMAFAGLSVLVGLIARRRRER